MPRLEVTIAVEGTFREGVFSTAYSTTFSRNEVPGAEAALRADVANEAARLRREAAVRQRLEQKATSDFAVVTVEARRRTDNTPEPLDATAAEAEVAAAVATEEAKRLPALTFTAASGAVNVTGDTGALRSIYWNLESEGAGDRGTYRTETGKVPFSFRATNGVALRCIDPPNAAVIVTPGVR